MTENFKVNLIKGRGPKTAHNILVDSPKRRESQDGGGGGEDPNEMCIGCESKLRRQSFLLPFFYFFSSQIYNLF